jgi:hypothetical protein
MVQNARMTSISGVSIQWLVLWRSSVLYVAVMGVLHTPRMLSAAIVIVGVLSLIGVISL